MKVEISYLLTCLQNYETFGRKTTKKQPFTEKIIIKPKFNVGLQ